MDAHRVHPHWSKDADYSQVPFFIRRMNTREQVSVPEVPSAHLPFVGFLFLTGGEVLAEVAEELTVEYCCDGGRAVLVFPEFFEEGVENTPARIIEHHTHGSGMYYRNCFVNRKLQFDEYAGKMAEALGVKVAVTLKDKNTGRLEIDFYNTDDFERLYDRLK